MTDDKLDDFMESHDFTEDDKIDESPLTIDEAMGIPEKTLQGWEICFALADELLTESERKRITIELNTDGGRPTIEFDGDDCVVRKLTREMAKRGCLPKGDEANN
jgi:hypothetical protein